MEIDTELGDFILVGYHTAAACNDGKVFRQTPQKVNDSFWPPSEYSKPNAITQWHWCMKCHKSTRTGDLNMDEVKPK